MRQPTSRAAGLEDARWPAPVIADNQNIGFDLLSLRHHSFENVSLPDDQGSLG
jgi:hypothetical protein